MIQREANIISGVILAGGESKRFGGVIKSNIKIGGLSIISRIINTISDIFGEIIIVTNTPDEYKSFNNYRIVSDQFLHVGPLAGIHSALKVSSKDSVFIFAGDMPFLDKEIIMEQIRFSSLSRAEVIIPRFEGNYEPLHAIYNNSIYNKLNEYLSRRNNYAIKDFLREVHVSYMDLPPSDKTKRAFTNINTPLSAEEANRFADI